MRNLVEILAGAIRSRAREAGLDPSGLTNIQINELGDAQYLETPNTEAAKFYGKCSDKQWEKVVRLVRR